MEQPPQNILQRWITGFKCCHKSRVFSSIFVLVLAGLKVAGKLLQKGIRRVFPDVYSLPVHSLPDNEKSRFFKPGVPDVTFCPG
ncbi:hypothetical protein J2Z49_001974 [Desulfofundulus luciae]|uniref:Uncharacterized protein n=1 Tax=Desulfofundulus luciae TaxID=74702 RepID=A0ABU0B2A5_9FIRM|nr:hypothetical protein [Desulfofundulus luciae]